MTTNSSNSKLNFWADWAVKILALTVIPIALWAGKLNSDIAVMHERMATQDKRLDEVSRKAEKSLENEKTLIRLEEQLKNANSKLDDIRKALSQ